MNDALIDPYQIEMMQEEIRMNPLNEDRRTKELIALYKFQQRLIRQWEEEEYKQRGG